LPSNIFAENSLLREIFMNENSLKIIHAQFPSNLRTLSLRTNDCINKRFPDDITDFERMKSEIKEKCSSKVLEYIEGKRHELALKAKELENSLNSNELKLNQLESEKKQIAEKLSKTEVTLNRTVIELTDLKGTESNESTTIINLQSERKQLQNKIDEQQTNITALMQSVSDFTIKDDAKTNEIAALTANHTNATDSIDRMSRELLAVKLSSNSMRLELSRKSSDLSVTQSKLMELNRRVNVCEPDLLTTRKANEANSKKAIEMERKVTDVTAQSIADIKELKETSTKNEESLKLELEEEKESCKVQVEQLTHVSDHTSVWLIICGCLLIATVTLSGFLLIKQRRFTSKTSVDMRSLMTQEDD